MQNNDNVSPENQPKIEVDNNGNADDFIAEVIPDDSNPQTGLTTTTSYRSDNAGGSNSPNKSDGGGSGSGSKMSRREASRIKNPGKIFVGGIPGSVNDHEFREFFKQFGEVTDSVVIFDGHTRRSRGFGFVTFKDYAVAQNILGGENKQIGSVIIRGKMCEVKPAEPKVDSITNDIQHHRQFNHQEHILGLNTMEYHQGQFIHMPPALDFRENVSAPFVTKITQGNNHPITTTSCTPPIAQVYPEPMYYFVPQPFDPNFHTDFVPMEPYFPYQHPMSIMQPYPFFPHHPANNIPLYQHTTHHATTPYHPQGHQHFMNDAPVPPQCVQHDSIITDDSESTMTASNNADLSQDNIMHHEDNENLPSMPVITTNILDAPPSNSKSKS